MKKLYQAEYTISVLFLAGEGENIDELAAAFVKKEIANSSLYPGDAIVALARRYKGKAVMPDASWDSGCLVYHTGGGDITVTQAEEMTNTTKKD